MDSFLVIKAVTLLLQPVDVALASFVIGLGLTRFGGWRPVGRTMIAAAAILLLCSVLPVGEMLLIPLETRFPVPSSLRHLDGIVVLGGDSDPRLNAVGGCTEAGPDDTRTALAAELGKRFAQARIHLTGGTGSVFGEPEPEAAEMRRCLIESGIAPQRITVETRSRATYENAELSTEIVKPGPLETWALITSASHMPRAIGAFRHVGWPVVAYPTEPAPPRWSVVDWTANQSALEFALHEWTGLVWYRLSGKSDEVFPGPDGEGAPADHLSASPTLSVPMPVASTHVAATLAHGPGPVTVR